MSANRPVQPAKGSLPPSASTSAPRKQSPTKFLRLSSDNPPIKRKLPNEEPSSQPANKFLKLDAGRQPPSRVEDTGAFLTLSKTNGTQPKATRMPAFIVALLSGSSCISRPRTMKIRRATYFWDFEVPIAELGSSGDFFFVISREGKSPRAFVKRQTWGEIPYDLSALSQNPIANYTNPELALNVTAKGADWISAEDFPKSQNTFQFTISDWVANLLKDTPFLLKDSGAEAKRRELELKLSTAQYEQSKSTRKLLELERKNTGLQDQVEKLSGELEECKRLLSLKEAPTTTKEKADFAEVAVQCSLIDSAASSSPPPIANNISPLVPLPRDTRHTSVQTAASSTDTPDAVTKRSKLRHQITPEPMESQASQELRIFFAINGETVHGSVEFPPSSRNEDLLFHCRDTHREFSNSLGKMSEAKVVEMLAKLESLDRRGKR